MLKKAIHLKDCSYYKSTNLNGYFGAHSSCELMDDLGIQTASIVHISNHHWERLSKKEGKKKCQFSQYLENVYTAFHN